MYSFQWRWAFTQKRKGQSVAWEQLWLEIRWTAGAAGWRYWELWNQSTRGEAPLSSCVGVQRDQHTSVYGSGGVYHWKTQHLYWKNQIRAARNLCVKSNHNCSLYWYVAWELPHIFNAYKLWLHKLLCHTMLQRWCRSGVEGCVKCRWVGWGGCRGQSVGVQSQKVVIAYFSSTQLLPSGFAVQSAALHSACWAHYPNIQPESMSPATRCRIRGDPQDDTSTATIIETRRTTPPLAAITKTHRTTPPPAAITETHKTTPPLAAITETRRTTPPPAAIIETRRTALPLPQSPRPQDDTTASCNHQAPQDDTTTSCNHRDPQDGTATAAITENPGRHHH